MPAKRIYLAGPMTGLPEYNYPAFNAESARLRALGYHVENPAENPEQSSWEDYLRQAIRQMLTCDMVALLPGWEGSRGAGFERSVALQVGMALVMADQITDAAPSSAEPIKRTLAGLKQKGTLKKWREEKGHLLVRIWSGEWRSYWRANGCGYTTDINEAGAYTLDSAISHSGHCDPSKKIEYHFLPETPQVQP